MNNVPRPDVAPAVLAPHWQSGYATAPPNGGRAPLGFVPGTAYSTPHATSSLAQLQREDVERSEKILNVEVASKLAGYEDPIKLVLPPILQEAAVLYVRRKYVVGGVACEVPERAPAPVSMVQEDVREVRLKRYGGDVDFNLNACCKPDLFQREMDLKVSAQHGALANELMRLGYTALLREGTPLVSALVRSSSAVGADTRAMALQYYKHQVFGALGKFTYPLHNLLAAAKKCAAYDISRAVKSVMILPHAVPELMAYTRAENMTYNINGIGGPQGAPVTLAVESGYSVPATTTSVYVHIPPPLHSHGAAAPVASHNSLERRVHMLLVYPPNNAANTYRVDHFNRKLETIPTAGDLVMLTLNMQSAIVAVPGEDTGNLLMQYPRSTVSTDASTESGRMQLRVHMGAVLKKPENVLILEDVAFNGVVACKSLLNKGGDTDAFFRDVALEVRDDQTAMPPNCMADIADLFLKHGLLKNHPDLAIAGVFKGMASFTCKKFIEEVMKLWGSGGFDTAKNDGDKIPPATKALVNQWVGVFGRQFKTDGSDLGDTTPSDLALAVMLLYPPLWAVIMGYVAKKARADATDMYDEDETDAWLFGGDPSHKINPAANGGGSGSDPDFGARGGKITALGDRGTTYSSDRKITYSNNGYLGALDDLTQLNKLAGMQTYEMPPSRP